MLCRTVRFLAVSVLVAILFASCASSLDLQADHALIAMASGRPASEAEIACRCVILSSSGSTGFPSYGPGILVVTADRIIFTPTHKNQPESSRRASIPISDITGTKVSAFVRNRQIQLRTRSGAFVVETDPVNQCEVIHDILSKKGVPDWTGWTHQKAEYQRPKFHPLIVIPRN